MLREWRREDTEQLMHSRPFLEEYVKQPRVKSGLKRYCRHFDGISQALMDKRELDAAVAFNQATEEP